MQCYSTDAALDYTQGYQEELDADKIYCRRSASLQQHSTIGPGAYRKNDGLDSNKKPAPVVRQRAKRNYETVDIVADGEDTQSAPTWNIYCKYI